MSAAIAKRSFGAKSRQTRLMHIRHRMDGHAQVVPDISLIRNTDISAFVEKVQTLLSAKATNRKVAAIGNKHALREQSVRYSIDSGAENSGLSLDYRLLWDDL